MATRKKTVTGRQMLALLEQAVEVRGGQYCYMKDGRTRCIYVADELGPRDKFMRSAGSPACMVGLALYLLIGKKEFKRWDAEFDFNACGGADSLFETLSQAEGFPYRFTVGAKEIAMAAQDAQDGGRVWESALCAAKDLVRGLEANKSLLK